MSVFDIRLVPTLDYRLLKNIKLHTSSLITNLMSAVLYEMLKE